MDGDNTNFTRQLSHREQNMLREEVLNEKIYASKNSRAGYLGALTRVQGQIESLFSTTDNVQTVQDLVKRYHDAWCSFEQAHIDYLSLVNSAGLSFHEAVEQFSQKYEAKNQFLECVSEYLRGHEANLSESSANVFKGKAHDYEYAESAASHTSHRSRTSRTSSRSSVQEKRANAAKAKLALQLAEEERRRTIEGELRLLTIEKRQRDLEREQTRISKERKESKL